MKNYNQQILKASEQSETIKLHTDFRKSIEIISTYPVLTQYIKLSLIMVDWYEDMIKKTNDFGLKILRGNFVYESMGNLQIYAENGNIEGFKPLVEDLKKCLTKMFVK